MTGAYIFPSVKVRLYFRSPPVSTDPVTGRPPTMMSPRGWEKLAIATRRFFSWFDSSSPRTNCTQVALTSRESTSIPVNTAM